MATGSVYRGPGTNLSYEKNYANSAGGRAEANQRAMVEAEARKQGLNPYPSYDPKQAVSPWNIPTTSRSTPVPDPRIINPTTLSAASGANVSAALQRMNQAPVAPPRQRLTGGGGGSGGGGGGGAAAAPMLSQEQLNWMAELLRSAAPGSIAAGTLDLPDPGAYTYAPFNGSVYDTLLNSFNQGVGMDQATATQAYQNLTNYLTQNQTNAFTNGNTTPTYSDPTQTSAMARLLQGQGVNAGANPGFNSAMQGQAAGDAAFNNLWRVLGANEDIANRNRLGNVQQQSLDTQNALNVAALSGRTGIGLQRAGAESAYAQQIQQMMREDWQAQQQAAQQEALANWQRANQVQDFNATNINSYRNNELQALLGLLPSLAGNPAGLPTMQALGLA
jgi:hypothetical protein